ncbi:hypothetical protein OH76DRAFT_1356337, partial [Lentinus brumalis]
GLSALISPFEEQSKLAFWTTRYDCIPLPTPFVDGPGPKDLSWLPHLCVSFPGDTEDRDVVRDRQWDAISMVVEVKNSASEDPFRPQRSAGAMKTLNRLVGISRSLLFYHGFLFTFVLGVFGDTVRIVRFDRTAALVSRPFNIRTEPHLVQRFFWHFTHPVVGGLVVGCDPTLRRLTLPEHEWLKRQLAHVKKPHKPSPTDLAWARRVEVHDDRDGGVTAYFRFKHVDAQCQFVTRTTTVWCAIEDKHVEDPRAKTAVKPRILKESWRPLRRQPEPVFYRRLARTVQVRESSGLPTFLHGGDLGQMEQDTPHPASHDSITSETSLPYPQHQTCSWSTLGIRYTPLEMSHVRFAIEEVGRSLEDFKDSRELVMAVRDAILGHRLAWEEAGILHRDISIGNILIVDERTPGGPTGFLHDFDAGFITRYAPGDPIPSLVALEAVGLAQKQSLQERKGTFFFTSLALLGKGGVGVVHQVYHDLESVYWTLLYVVLRHTVHSLGQRKCKEIFYNDSDDEGKNVRIAVARKRRWLNAPSQDAENNLIIYDNAPLTKLMRDYKSLVRAMYAQGLDGKNILTYVEVLRLFDETIESSGWPEQDRITCYLSGPTGRFHGRHGTKSASAIVKAGVKRDYASLVRYPFPAERESDEKGKRTLRKGYRMKKRRKLASATRIIELRETSV